METPEIIIYTDGSSRGNPGPGGYGIIIEKNNSNYFKEFSQGFRLTTNNRMELLAVIEALKNIKNESNKYMYILIQNMLLIQLKKDGCLIGKKRTLNQKKTLIFGSLF